MINIEEYSPEKHDVKVADIVLKTWGDYLLLQGTLSEKIEILKNNQKVLLLDSKALRKEFKFSIIQCLEIITSTRNFD